MMPDVGAARIRLEPVTRPAECCATCQRWRLDRGVVWCPAVDSRDGALPRNLRRWTCRVWAREWYESAAVELYEELRHA